MALHVKENRRSSEQKEAAIEEATKDEVTRLNVLIPETLHRDLKLQAIAEGKSVTITSIIIRAASEYLSKYGDVD